MYYSLATWPSVPRTYEVTIFFVKLGYWTLESNIAVYHREKKIEKKFKKFKVIKTEEEIIERVYKWFQALDDNVFQT